MQEMTRETLVPTLAEIFSRRASEAYIGEPVSIGAHMLQSAQLAEQAGAPEAVIVAALLHDVGHFTHDFPEDSAEQGIDSQHEDAGARILDGWFPPLVVDCVRQHVAAKRYLCATDPAYFGTLSEASVLSLKLQGGPMTPDEVAAFEANPSAKAIVQVRLWDDLAKVPGLETPAFDHYAPMIQRVVDSHGEAG